MTDERECGSCTACCVWLGIEALNKPAGVPCNHLSKVRTVARRCSIYKDRPTPCQTYQCAWLQGAFAAHMRPDRAGMMVSLYKGETPVSEYGATIQVFDERRAGSLKEGALRDFVLHLLSVEICDIRIIHGTSKSMIWVCGEVIRQCTILPNDSNDVESLKFEAYDPPIGRIGLGENKELD